MISDRNPFDNYSEANAWHARADASAEEPLILLTLPEVADPLGTACARRLARYIHHADFQNRPVVEAARLIDLLGLLEREGGV
jgi:hypothetical protein